MANYRQSWFDDNQSNHGWYTCVRCGKKLRKGDVDIDHIIPQSRGGRDNRDNLQCMCRHCNRSKRDSVGVDTIRDYSRNVAKNTSKDARSMFGKLFK